MRLENFLAFDSEFRTAEGGGTELATIQFSLLEDGVPLAWVVDLNPIPVDEDYSLMTRAMLRWIFIVSSTPILGFAHHYDVHMIASYIGEDIPLSPTFFDLQLLAAHGLADTGMSALPGLKSCCTHWMEDNNDMTSWLLSKKEQCSNWT